MDTETKLKIKRSGLRAIDRGTRYDISGELRKLARRIEAGEFGSVRHIVVGITQRNMERGEPAAYTTTYGFGQDSVADMSHTVDMMKNRFIRGEA